MNRFATWYTRNKERVIARARERNKADPTFVARNRVYQANYHERIRAQKAKARMAVGQFVPSTASGYELARDLINRIKAVPCLDCGNYYPSHIMDFDHVRGQKRFNVGHFAYASDRLIHEFFEEVIKCEVVCANCHRERTHRRFNKMPMPEITTTTTTEVKLSPALRRKLVLLLRQFALNKATIEALMHAQQKAKDDIERAFVESGEFNALQEGVKAEGFNVRHVSPISSRFDKKKAIGRGYITTAQIDECSQAKPGRPYVVIRTPGETDESTDE